MLKKLTDQINLNSNLDVALLKAAKNPENWTEALSLLAIECGALAAIITLRSSKNAEIVISSEMKSEFHTPFVGGFPQEMVKMYVENFRTNDPWAKVQSSVHPHVPTLMSDHLPIKEFAKTDFGKWVSNDVFNDTVVVEIGNSSNHWTALNLYLMNNDPQVANSIKKNLNDLLENVKLAWAISRIVQQSQATQEQLFEEIRNSSSACALLTDDGKVVVESAGLEKLKNIGAIEISKKNSCLKVCNSIHLDTDLAAHVTPFETEGKMGAGFSARFDDAHSNIISTGEQLGFTAVVFEHWKDSVSLPWENALLSEREKLLTITIAKTNRVSECEEVLGVGERQVRHIWQSVRNKLPGLTKPDLVSLYRKQQH